MSKLVLSGDTSGSVTLDVPAVSGTTTLTLPTTSGIVVTSANIGIYAPNTMKNRIINGDMVVDQRNNGASITPTSTVALTYNVDRWETFCSASSKFSVQQNAGSVTPPVGFTNYVGVTSLSAYTVGASEEFSFGQLIEGFNIADLGWGTANARTVTLSFWVRSSLTGTFGGSLRNGAANRSYAFTYTISSANTWTQISITIAGDTSGTWLTTNGIGMRVLWGLGVGASASTSPNSWTAGNFSSATGATSVVGTNGATFYITGVQLEQGSSATSFEWLPYGTELALCQRYYQLVTSIVGGGNTSARAAMQATFQVPMRGVPTLGLQGVIQLSDTTTDYIQSSAVITNLGTTNNASIFFLDNFTGLTVARVLIGPRNSANTNTVTLSAEL